ncbi:SIMPL domain-containing protein [Pseudoduganella sp. SL102]|uniref:SIMPL domain-containing protein n=1 Tax=Pseudoduganella sp. SL102 TaxID=2995154 RepID=UPI00248B7C9B|nr:SIMPL domain-containing protein [Pseudoduganella sp. SL102]WBS03592.1 SIMPL domain-containing protein [Pseudoduganella sp. SL102]
MRRRLLPILVTAAGCAAMFASAASAADLPAHPFVSTTGKAQIWVAPDIAALYFDTGAQDGSAEQAAASLDELSTAIAALLAEHGVAENDIDGSELAKKTVALSKPAADGGTSAYLLTRHYRVQVRDLGRLPGLVAALLARDHVDSLSASFERTDKDSIDRELMGQAAADARANGTLLAEAFGRKLGPAVAIARAPLDKMGQALLEPPGAGRPTLPAAQGIKAYSVPPAIPFAQSVTAVFKLGGPSADTAAARKASR